MDRRYTNDSPRSQREPDPDPFKTRVIHRPNAWWGLGLCIVLAAVMLVLMVLMGKDAFDGFNAILGALAVIAIFLASLWGIGHSFYHLICQFHLVLARNSVQLRNRDGDVLGQIPYRNVASLEILVRRKQGPGPGSEVLQIILHDPDDRTTWWKGWQEGDEVIELPNHYLEPIRDIRDWIGERVALIEEGVDPAATAVEQDDPEDTDFAADERITGAAGRRRAAVPEARRSRSPDDEDEPRGLRAGRPGMPPWGWALIAGGVVMLLVLVVVVVIVA